jgi:hypothetical protein
MNLSSSISFENEVKKALAPLPTAAELAARFGAINNENDLSDARRQSSGDRKAAEADKRKSPGPDPGLSGATLRAGGGCCAPTTGN